MDLTWEKGMKYTLTSRSQIILQKNSTNKGIFGNRSVMSSEMARINSGKIKIRSNGSNSRASGRIISGNFYIQGQRNLGKM